MANVSPALQWSVIRKSSSFVIKRDGRTFTTEPNNLRNINSFRYNGLVQEQTVGVEASSDGKGVTLTTRNKKRNHPSKNLNRSTLKKNPRRAFKTIMSRLKGQQYRKDLQSVSLTMADVTPQQKLQSGLNDLKNVQRDLQKRQETRQTLDAQLSENKLVKEELDLVKPDTKVYKLIGPTLVRQDLEEAKQTVSKRIEYISAELKRSEEFIKDLEEKQDGCQEQLAKLKHEFDQAGQKAQKPA
ncbi:uncharacterized protein [Watersipora subatra]|uniref:uncharacterized protein n=1 Tax=Watersipora subatra TaxID=2589382 RepID=UPI00355BF4F6